MTKKSFIQEVDCHNYGSKKTALFYDWKSGDFNKGEHYRGFKFMVWANKGYATKKELMDILYQWVNSTISQPPYYVGYKFADTDNDRFKVPVAF